MKVALFWKKLQEYLGYFCKKICYQEVQKIAQSGQTDYDSRIIIYNRKVFVRMTKDVGKTQILFSAIFLFSIDISKWLRMIDNSWVIIYDDRKAL